MVNNNILHGKSQIGICRMQVTIKKKIHHLLLVMEDCRIVD